MMPRVFILFLIGPGLLLMTAVWTHVVWKDVDGESSASLQARPAARGSFPARPDPTRYGLPSSPEAPSNGGAFDASLRGERRLAEGTPDNGPAAPAQAPASSGAETRHSPWSAFRPGVSPADAAPDRSSPSNAAAPRTALSGARTTNPQAAADPQGTRDLQAASEEAGDIHQVSGAPGTEVLIGGRRVRVEEYFSIPHAASPALTVVIEPAEETLENAGVLAHDPASSTRRPAAGLSHDEQLFRTKWGWQAHDAVGRAVLFDAEEDDP